MKLITLTTLFALLATVSAFAAPKARTPFEKLKADAENTISIFDYQKEVCDIRVKEMRNGYTVSVKEGNNPVVYFDVYSDHKIKLIEAEEESSDGSYSRRYEVANEGSVEFVHMDDAYDHFYIQKDGKETACELDY